MKTGKHLNRILSMIMVLAMILTMMPTMTAHAADHTGGRVYFETDWTTNVVQLMIGHSGWSQGYQMTKGTGNLYYVDVPTWEGAWDFAVFGTDSVWGGEGNSIANRKSWATQSTGVDTSGYQFKAGSKYLITSTGSNNISVKVVYDVTVAETSNGTVTADKSLAGNQETVRLTVTPADGYELDALSVKQGTTAVTVNDNAFTMPNGNVTVSATFKKTLQNFTVTNTLTNLTSNGSTTVVEGSTYSATLTPADGFKLPDSVTVSMGGTALTSGYTYDSATGKLEIPNVSGNIVVTAAAVALNTVYFINASGWSNVTAYAWNEGGAGLTWPGIAMEKTDKTVNGFDVYSITLDTAYENVIFNNNGNGSQTADLKWTNGQFYDLKSGKWYSSLEDVPAVDQTATDFYLVGSFNGWSTTANEFKLNAAEETVGYVSLTLEANTEYEFKLVKSGAWLGNNGTITESITGWVFDGGDNCKIKTGMAGEYVFAVNITTNSLSVTYPQSVVYNVTFNYTNVTGSNTATTIQEGTDYTTTLSAGTGFVLPETVTVSVGGTTLTSGYTYDSATGVLTVDAASITGDVVITAKADAAPMKLYLDPNMWDVDNAWFAAYYWDTNGSAWAKMLDSDGDGIYEAEIPAGTSNVIFCRMDPAKTALSWERKWNQTGDLTIPNNGNNLYTVPAWDGATDGSNWSIYTPGSVDPDVPTATYYVAGDEALCGVHWNEKAEDNKMNYDGNGIFSKVYTNVAAGTYNLKVTDGTWNNTWGDNGSNYNFAVSATCDVTVTFDSNTKTVTVSGDSVSKVTTLEVTSMHAVGNGSGAWLGGVVWDPMANTMTEVSENVYEITFKNVVKGSNYLFKFAANGNWDNSWGAGSGANEAAHNGADIPLTVSYEKADVTLKIDLTNYNHTSKQGATYTVTVTEAVSSSAEYYLVGYINGADDDGNTYKFVDGSLTVELSAESYVLLKDSTGQHYIPAAAVSDATSAVLNKGDWDYDRKVKVPSGKITFTLTENTDGSLTLSYDAAVDLPQIPDGYNTVTIHFLKPTTWGASVNGYVWTDSGAVPGYEAFNVWPGSPIPANADKGGWYDLTVGTENPQSFNFIFNDGSSQTADLTTGEVTGPTELWVVGNDVYTSAPIEWTHYTAIIHFQKPGNWGNTVNAYAWTENGEFLLEPWPGTVASASVNSGWYNTIIRIPVGKPLSFIFNDGSNQTADIDYGNVNGNIELWIDSSGNSIAAPNGWVDESRTVHVPGTFPGPSWDAASNQMTYDPNRGLYVITFENVTPGTYYYKIAINGGWGENYGAGGTPSGNDIAVNVPTAQDVTIWYSDVTHRTLCSVDYDIDAVVNLSGTGIPAGTKLTDPNLTGTFTATVKLPAGKHSDITLTFGDYSFTFAEFELTAEKEVTFSFDPSSYLAYHNGSDKKVETGKIFYNTKDLKYKDPFGAVATGENVTFAIETGTDASQVSLIVKGSKGIAMEKDGGPVDGVQRWKCTTKFDKIGEYQYYFAITNGSDMVIYTDDNYNHYYKKGDYGTGTIGNLNDIFAYDLVVYQAGYTTPDWMKNAVIYQIFPDRFFDGDETNNQAQSDARGSVDYEYVSDWYLLPENPEMAGKDGYPVYAYKGDGEWSNEIYGGDLEGITERIGYLKALGVNVIYLNPVFSSISNHRYDACDYMQIDPVLGTLGDFEELVAVADANGMKIILDGVFNHVSDDSVYFDRYYKFLGTSEKIGAYPYWAYVYDYMAEKSVSQADAEVAAKTYFSENYGITDYSYTEWFAVNNKQATYSDSIGLRAGKKVYTYEGWWGYDSMPVIKSTNGSEYQSGNWAEEIINNADGSSVTQYWINKGNDGWRLDVANEVSDETWIHFRNSVKALNSDAVIIGEIWADATHYLMGNMYDSVMNYVFRDAVAGFARGYLINRDDKSVKFDDDYIAEDAIKTLEILRERYPEEAFYAMMNLVSSHDTSRILSYLDDVEDDRYQKDMDSAFPTYEKTSSRAKQLQYVVAFIQYTYAGAPTVYYGDEIGMVGGDDPDDRRAMEWGMGNQTLVEWYAKLAAIRSQYPALRTGSVDAFAPSRDVMGYVRSDDSDTLIVLANRAASQATVELDLVELGLINGNTRAAVTLTDVVSGKTYTADNNKVTVSVDAYRGAILTQNVKSYTVNTDALAPAYDSSYIVPDRADTAPKGTYNTQNGQEVTIGDSLSFTVDAVVNTFVGVSVDGEKVDEEAYEVQIGTVVTLSAELIEELGEGEHEIEIEFEGGSAKAKFTVVKAGSGDPDQPGGNDPDQPGGDDPDQPGGNDPDQPGGNDPDQPGGNDPDQPGGDDPDQPGGDDGDGEESKPTDSTESTKPGTGDNSSTGDTSGIGIWIAVLGVSMVAVIILLILGLKKKQRD